MKSFFEFNNILESCFVNNQNFQVVKDIENAAYPSHMRFYQDFDSVEDLLNYADCDGTIDCILKPDWYALFCVGSHEVEIIDVASKNGKLDNAAIFILWRKLKSLGDKTFNMNARATTSYPLVKGLEKLGWIQILSDEPNNLYGEPMHAVEFIIVKNEGFKEWLQFIESIDPKDEPAIQNFITQNHPDKSQEINTFLQQFRNDPNIIPKATIFQSLNRQFPIQRNVEAIDPKVVQIYQSVNIPINTVTKPEIATLTRFKDENPELLKELATKLRNYIQNKVISLTINNNLITISYFAKDEQNQRTKTAKAYQSDDLTKTISYIHMIDSMEDDTEVLEKDLADPRELAVTYKHELVAVSNNKKIYVFKAKDPIQCRRMGKGQKWCISSSDSVSYYFDYRFQHGQTQYFIFDFNKAPDDPARYVNPGVAPKGYYSEWVDRRNKHEKDPNDPYSHFGINGYDSIDDYLEYLESQGIDSKVFVAEAVSGKEREFENENEDLRWFKNLAPNDQIMYMQIHPLTFEQFESLSEKDKKFYLNNNSQNRIIYRLMENAEDKQKLVNFILQYKKKLTGDDVYAMLFWIPDKQMVKRLGPENVNKLNYNDKLVNLLSMSHSDDIQEFAKLLIQYKKELSGENVDAFLHYSTDKQEIAQLLGSENISKLNDFNVKQLLINAEDTQEMANILGLENINKLTAFNVYSLLNSAIDKQEMANALGLENISKLTDLGVYELLRYATDKQEIAEILGSENIKKLGDYSIRNLLSSAADRHEMAKLIIQYKKELFGGDVYSLLRYATDKQEMANILGSENISKLLNGGVYSLLYDAEDKQEMAEILGSENINKLSDNNVLDLLRKDRHEMAKLIIQYKKELTGGNVYWLLNYATDKQEIANALGLENISKLTDYNVDYLLRYATDKQEMAKILNQYHNNKTPEMQELINQHL